MKECSVIMPAYTVSYPEAVMVIPLDAYLTLPTMFGAIVTDDLALLAFTWLRLLIDQTALLKLTKLF
jgi:hypothetical protein